jgi:hypothetical protein
MNDNRTQAEEVPWSQWWGMVILATAVLAGLEFMVYHALAPLERGEPVGMAVWAPIATAYELFGYIPAMLIIPMLWFLLACIISWQTLVRLRAERNKHNEKQHVT